MSEFVATIAPTATVIVVMLMPGACAAAGFEWHAQRYGRRGKGWVLSLILHSGLWFALGAWPLHWLAITYWDRVVALDPLPWALYLVPAMYLVVPAAGGWGLGKLATKFPAEVKALLGRNREPTAWDYLFGAEKVGFLHCRLRSGRWVGGLYGEAEEITSWASSDEDRGAG